MSTLSTINVKHPTSASNNISLDNAGNVGIGTSSPGTKLDTKGRVRSSIGTGTGAGGAGYAFYEFGTSSVATENWHIGAEGDGTFRFYNQGFGAGLERARITSGGDFQFNSGYGSVATAYGCRAWVNFNGTGVVAIRASGNVSSITDNGTGDYTVNFTTAMPDANYAAGVLAQNNSGVNADEPMVCGINGGVSPTTSAVRFNYRRLAAGGGTIADPVICTIAVFR